MQLAKYFGAEVTGVCSTAKLDLVKSLGADRVIDYTAEDFTKNGQTYDIIFDTVSKISISRSKGSLKKTGYYVFATFGLFMLVQMLWFSWVGRLRVVYGVLGACAEDLVFLKGLIEAGAIKPVVDRCYLLDQIVEAHRYVESGHKKGNVVVTVP